MTQQNEGFKAKVLLAAIVVTIVGLPAGALALRQWTANSSRIPFSLLDDDGSADQGRGNTTDSAETTNEGGDVSDPRNGGDDDDNSGFGHGGDRGEDNLGSGHGGDNDNLVPATAAMARGCSTSGARGSDRGRRSDPGPLGLPTCGVQILVLRH